MKRARLKKINILIIILLGASFLKAQTIALIQQNPQTSIRGLSVVDDNIAWVSGSKGHVAITTNSGKTWTWHQVKGFETSDFRDIEAFSDKEAVIMSSGTPALILKTIDGGANWIVKYRNTDTAYFCDAMDFANPKHGLALGDPIRNKFVLLETIDMGETWKPLNNPPVALPGEAAFAASGTCLRTIESDIFIVSGGTSANLVTCNTKNKKWKIMHLPLLQGKASQGCFSIAKGNSRFVAVGGDYELDKRRDSTACYSIDGLKWQLATIAPAGFQSCVEFIGHNIFLSTGTPGSNITLDGGKTWKKIDDTSYNVCRRAKHGKLVLLAGNGGKIGVFKM